MMRHEYPRTERDLRMLAVAFSAGQIDVETLPIRLEYVAASLRCALEAEKQINGAHNEYAAASGAAIAIAARMNAAGIR